MAGNTGTIENPIPSNFIWKGTDGLFRQIRDASLATGSGGDGSGDHNVLAPAILGPEDGATDVNVVTTLQAGPYRNNFEDKGDARAYRQFQIRLSTSSISWNDTVFDKSEDADSISLDYDQKLNAYTSYIWRCRDVSSWGQIGDWSEEATFTTGAETGVLTPSITVEGETNDVPGDPLLTGSEFSVSGGEDTHDMTDWEILNTAGTSVWSLLNSSESLTSVRVPYGILTTSTTYTARVRYHGATFGWSGWGSKQVSTRSQFVTIEAPTVTVEGAPDSVLEAPTITLSAFTVTPSTYTDTHVSTDWEVRQQTNNNLVWSSYTDTTNKTSITIPRGNLQEATAYIFRARFNGATYDSSEWGEATGTTVEKFAYIQAPTLTVTGSPNRVPACPVMRGGDFTVVTEGDTTDTHESSDWAVYDATGSTLIWQSENDKTNLTTCRVPYGYLQEGATYIFKVRYKGATLGYTDWVQVQATCMVKFSTIGIPGTAGFGVGVFPGTQAQLTALGLTEAGDGTYNPTSEDYGLYKGSFGNVRFIPKFYYKVGYTEADATDVFYSQDPSFPEKGATYAVNALAIVGSETFSSEAEANEAGYVLHRAFIDGGEEQDGFFIDEFIASRGTDGTSTTAQSVANGKIISLVSSSSYTRSADMTSECAGLYADAITLGKARGDEWNCASTFMYSALAMLSLCHGEFSSSDAYCAWYDSTGTTNYPKGCNNDALGDTDDASIVYTTCGDSGSSAKPLTGSCNYPAKVAHNGQACGIKDINGCVWETSVGCFSNKGTTYIYNDDAKLADFTRDMATTPTMTLFHSAKWPSDADGALWGNGENAVLYDDASGDNRALCGCYPKEYGYSSSGTNLFGKDYDVFFVRSDVSSILAVGGGWGDAAIAGVFARYGSRSGKGWGEGYRDVGFRAAAYPPAE